jgi:hypothetical protein
VQQSMSLKVYLALDIIHEQHYIHYSWVETGEHTTDKKAQKFTAQLQCIRICYSKNRKSLRRTHEFMTGTNYLSPNQLQKYYQKFPSEQ